jgi:hypothetical protein
LSHTFRVSTMFRRLRSALVLGLVWGAVWLPVGVTMAMSKGWLRFPFRWVDWAAIGAWTGLAIISGATFAFLLARRERTQTVDTLHEGRVLGWGLLAGGGVPVALSAVLLMLFPNLHLAPGSATTFAIMGATGAASALLTLSLAKRGRERVAVAGPEHLER